MLDTQPVSLNEVLKSGGFTTLYHPIKDYRGRIVVGPTEPDAEPVPFTQALLWEAAVSNTKASSNAIERRVVSSIGRKLAEGEVDFSAAEKAWLAGAVKDNPFGWNTLLYEAYMNGLEA